MTYEYMAARVRFLCSELLLNKIFLPTQFLVYTSFSFRVMSQKDMSMVGPTDARGESSLLPFTL